jgi:TRAP-type C4-dicarboxylate transport system permease small subunit
MGGMLRTTVLDGFVGRTSRLRLAMLTNVAGIAFFVLLAVAVWEPMWRAIEIREYQGEGGLRVPTYPVRIVIFVTSLLAALAYLSTLVKVVCTGQVPSADTEHATHG